jgi:hypothetical protein
MVERPWRLFRAGILLCAAVAASYLLRAAIIAAILCTTTARTSLLRTAGRRRAKPKPAGRATAPLVFVHSTGGSRDRTSTATNAAPPSRSAGIASGRSVLRLVAALQSLEQPMKDDPLQRARQALQTVDTRRPQPPALDQSKGRELLARAQAAIAAPPKQPLVATPPPALPRAERVKLPMTCSATGRSYVEIAERRGNHLRFVGHEMPRTRQDGECQPGFLSGEYQIDMKDWTCPLCRHAGAWQCSCPHHALHCRGSSGGKYHCACGRFEEHEFVNVEKVEVRGASVAATPEPTRSGSQRGQPQFKQVSHERNR